MTASIYRRARRDKQFNRVKAPDAREAAGQKPVKQVPVPKPKEQK